MIEVVLGMVRISENFNGDPHIHTHTRESLSCPVLPCSGMYVCMVGRYL